AWRSCRGWRSTGEAAAFPPDLSNACNQAERRLIPHMPLVKLRVECPDLASGQAASAVLEEMSAPAPLAVTLFELRLPRFLVEAYFEAPPALEDVSLRLAACDRRLAGAVALEAVADQNWVALSQAALPPVAAGRLIVHGSHDRARFAMRPLAVEIDAGEAFGSGHNATTALCLE